MNLVIEGNERRFARFELSGVTIHFTSQEPLPKSLI